MKLCRVEHCERTHHAKGLCLTHYTYRRKYGKDCAQPRIKKDRKECCRQYSRKYYKKHHINKPKRPLCVWPGCCIRPFLPHRHNGLCGKHAVVKTLIGERRRNPGIIKEKNPNWKGGVSQYKDHYLFKKNRLEILEKCNYVCELCNDTAQIVHHKDNTSTNHSIENLMPLCQKCHCTFRVYKTSKYKRLYGMNLHQIAQKLGVSVTTVVNRHKKGKLFL